VLDRRGLLLRAAGLRRAPRPSLDRRSPLVGPSALVRLVGQIGRLDTGRDRAKSIGEPVGPEVSLGRRDGMSPY
jgi:hypothetical protein